VYEAERFATDGRRILLEREDLWHTGAHKINNAFGQALPAMRLGKHRVVAETGAGQHGVATATVCARWGLECTVYMGSEDMRRQRPNVERMRLLGAEVQAVELGTRTLKEATSEAIRDWIDKRRHVLLSDRLLRRPTPVSPDRARAAVRDRARGAGAGAGSCGQAARGVVACVGGSSNAIGLFAGFLNDDSVGLVAGEAEGAASLVSGTAGCSPRRSVMRARRR
jgi:tryptophan synthase beta chain